MKYCIKETVERFHEIEIDDELADQVTTIAGAANDLCRSFDEGVDALSLVLEQYKKFYGFDYDIIADYCGKEIAKIEVVDEVLYSDLCAEEM